MTNLPERQSQLPELSHAYHFDFDMMPFRGVERQRWINHPGKEQLIPSQDYGR